MRKNKMMRAASALLVAVLLTTSTISGTFAKYASQDSAEDTARVAKWGVELQVVGNLFGDTYKDLIVNEDDANLTVQSIDKAADIVAPGTKSEEGLTISLKGQPEVDGEVTTTLKVQNIFLKGGSYGIMVPVATGVVTDANFDEFEAGTLFKKNGDQYVPAVKGDTANLYTLEDDVTFTGMYYPVVYTLAGNTSTSSTNTEDSLNKAAGAIATQLGITADPAAADTSVTYTGTKAFAANTDLAGWSVDDLKLTWIWEFDIDDETPGDPFDEDTDPYNRIDKQDTILGHLITEKLNDGTINIVKNSGGNVWEEPVEYTDYCLETTFELEMVVVQVD